MSDVAICTDSSALFPAGIAELLGVIRVPVSITLDGEVYDSDDVDEFYELLSSGAKAATSQPSTGDFLVAYGAAEARGAGEVLSIHLDARVSGTVAGAELAARDAPIPVRVVDTGTVSFGVGVCVRAAAEAVAAGASAGRAAGVARRVGPRLRNVFVAAGAPRGRMGNVSGWGLLEFVDGKPQPVAACGSVQEALDAMAERIGEAFGPIRAAVGHAGAAAASAADALAVLLASSSRVMDVERYRVEPAVGAHTGPLSFGAFWWPAESPAG